MFPYEPQVVEDTCSIIPNADLDEWIPRRDELWLIWWKQTENLSSEPSFPFESCQKYSKIFGRLSAANITS